MMNKLKAILEKAHMAGQINADVDPSYSEAQRYAEKALETIAGVLAPAGYLAECGKCRKTVLIEVTKQGEKNEN